MALNASRHLDCLFNCEKKFSDLESLYEHIEIDHREDDTVSPFMVQDGSGVRSRIGVARMANGDTEDHTSRSDVQESYTAASSNASRPSAIAQDCSTARDSDNPEFVRFVECPQRDCREPVLLSELNEHLDLHEVEHIDIYGEPSLAPDHTPHLSGGEIHNRSQVSLAPTSSPTGHTHSSTGVNPTLRNSMEKVDRNHDHSRSRAHLGRNFLSMLSDKSRSRKKVTEKTKSPKGETERLGKAQLGPYAHEDQMPTWMYKRLKAGPKIVQTRKITRNGGLVTHEIVDGQTSGVLPVLKRLIELDVDIHKAYLCHPSVIQVGKTRWESGFCGFRNSQMLISYIQTSKHPAQSLFSKHIPGILDLQDWIEDGWAEGINAFTREEFGGLRGTRKWIGTLEVNTLFRHLDIQHQVHQFHDTDEAWADKNLMDWVEQYFKEGSIHDGKKIKCTLRPPIYFQQPGHSLTIVGMERLKDRTRNLLVFDPMYAVPRGMQQLIEQGDPRRIGSTNRKLLRSYRRSQYRLYNYADFEAITLGGDLPLFPAWDVGKG